LEDNFKYAIYDKACNSYVGIDGYEIDKDETPYYYNNENDAFKAIKSFHSDDTNFGYVENFEIHCFKLDLWSKANLKIIIDTPEISY